MKPHEEKPLAHWIYYEEGDLFYCGKCVSERVEEINLNREFADEINYDAGDVCGIMCGIPEEEDSINCCSCGVELQSLNNNTHSHA